MFITLLIVVFVVAVIVSTIVTVLFEKPIRQLLSRTVSDDLTNAWSKISEARDLRRRHFRRRQGLAT